MVFKPTKKASKIIKKKPYICSIIKNLKDRDRAAAFVVQILKCA